MRKIARLIIHHSAGDSGTVEAFRAEHKKRGWSDIGYHWVIGNGHGLPDGHIAQGRPVEKVGAAVKNRNAGNLYVCLVGDLTQHPPTEKQLAALGHWLLVNGCRFNVPSQNVLGHREWALAGHGTQCPGRLDLMAIRAWYHENITLARQSQPVESLADYLERHS